MSLKNNAIILTGLIGLTFLVACSSSKNTQTNEKEVVKKELFTEDSISLSFERSVCFGTCPAYKIVVQNDGTCFYEGYKFIDKIGKYTASISKEQMTSIQEEALRIGYFELEDEYDANITDVPSVMIMMPGPNGRKSVMDRAEAPETLKQFERFIDSILLNLDWKKVD